MSDFRADISQVQTLKSNLEKARDNIDTAASYVQGQSQGFMTQLIGKYMLTFNQYHVNTTISLKTVHSGLDKFATTISEAHSDLSGDVRSSRDKVLKVVNASAANSNVIYLKKGNSVVSNTNRAMSNANTASSAANRFSGQAGNIEHGSSSSSALSDLATYLDGQADTLSDLSSAWNDFDTAVAGFEGTYSSALTLDNLITEEAIENAISSTKGGFNSGWGVLGFGKSLASNIKNGTKFVDEVMKFAAKSENMFLKRGNYLDLLVKKGRGVPLKGFNLTKKFGKDYMREVYKTGDAVTDSWSGIRNLFSSRKSKFARQMRSNWKGGGLVDPSGKAFSKTLDKADDFVTKGARTTGKVAKVGKAIGVVGDIMALGNIAVKTANAENKVAVAVTETTKFAAGKAAGFAVGAAIGGPVGAVAGVAIGMAVEWGVGKVMDWAFKGKNK